MRSIRRISFRQAPLPFEDAAPWTGDGLEGALTRVAGRPVHLTLTENRSVLLSFRRQDGKVHLRLHRMFLHAPMPVVQALAGNLVRRRRSTAAPVRRFMHENLHRVRRDPKALPPLLTEGRVHDLKRAYDRLNERFFAGLLRVPITWGRGVGRARRGGLTFGSYDPVQRLIRVHPVLDRREVPLYFLESVVHHEMLHHHMGGVPDRSGRSVYHTRAFREAEASFPYYRQALAWEKENLSLLLKASQALDRERRFRLAAARAAARASR